MISLKKYLDMEVEVTKEPVEPDPSDLLGASLASYGSTLRTMGESGGRACPAVSSDLRQALKGLADRLGGKVTPQQVTETGKQANDQLQEWSNRTVDYFNTKTAEVKELLITLARTAESVGERDQKYAGHFNRFTTQLKAISNLEDLTQIRSSLVKQAGELKTYVDQMEQDSHKLVKTLQTEVSTYETRLKKVEELALRDALTGLANRPNVEERIKDRIERRQSFCVVMLDLNRLKQVNDKHGHMAGDNLLQQFAQELRSNMRTTDVVGRWGGDEFLLVVDGDEGGTKAQIDRLKKWVFGEYTIRPGKGRAEVKVKVDAALGLAQWKAEDTLDSIVERADAEMYAEKKAIGSRK